MTCLVLEPEAYSRKAIAIYRSIGPVHLGDAPDPASVKFLVVRLAHRIDAELLARFRSLEAVVTPTTGLNHIDTDACEEAGVAVYSLRDLPEALERITSTSELTLGLILALVRRIPQAHADVVDGNRWDRNRFKGRQVAGLTLGLVGLGRIGKHVAGYAEALGMNVLATDPKWPSDGYAFVKRCELEELLADSDIVSLHVRYGPDTHGLIGSDQIARMRPGSLLINTSRGEVLDEEAAASALANGCLRGIAIDVLGGETEFAQGLGSHPLIAAAREGKNVIVTPHIGGCSEDAMHLTEEMIAAYVVEQFAQGEHAHG